MTIENNYVPAVGEAVLVQGHVAEIFQYRPEGDQLIYIIKEGASSDYITAHISNTRIEPLPDGTHTVNAAEHLVDAEDRTRFISDGAPVETDAEGTERTTTVPIKKAGVQSSAGEASGDQFVTTAIEAVEGE